jgi:inorganic pyrophosphatase
MHPWHDISPGQNIPDALNVIVEIPKGSRNKYELNKESGFYELSRVLYSPMIYPGDYGFIPQTYYDDDDPLDAILLINEPTFVGCLVEARPIGIFKMMDKGQADDKILCVPKHNPFFATTADLKDVPPHFLIEVAHFFAVYKDLEGSRTLSLGWEDANVAHKQIEHGINLYNEHRDNLEGWEISETYQRIKLKKQEDRHNNTEELLTESQEALTDNSDNN